jgi:hypothetical protein
MRARRSGAAAVLWSDTWWLRARAIDCVLSPTDSSNGEMSLNTTVATKLVSNGRPIRGMYYLPRLSSDAKIEHDTYSLLSLARLPVELSAPLLHSPAHASPSSSWRPRPRMHHEVPAGARGRAIRVEEEGGAEDWSRQGGYFLL